MGNELMELRRRVIAAGPHKETATGTVASFNANTTLPPPRVVVDVGITQDLQGYDYPWVAGSVSNMIPDGTDTNNGYEFGKVLLNDNTTSNSNVYYISEYFEVEPDTQYALSQISTNGLNTGCVCFYDSNKEFISGEAFSKRTSFTVTSPSTAAYCRCNQARRDMIPHITNQLQMEKGSTSTDIYPYSNVCPITGYNTIPVRNRTKNLLPLEDMIWVTGAYLNNAGDLAYNASYKFCYTYIPVKPSTTYTFQYYRNTSSGAVRIHFYNSSNGFVDYTTTITSGASKGVRYGTFTTPSTAAYIRLGTFSINSYDYQLVEGSDNPEYSDINKVTNVTVYANSTGRKFFTGTLTINKDGSGTFAREYIGYICDGSGDYDTWATVWNGTENAVFRFVWDGSLVDVSKPKAYSSDTDNTYCKSSHFRTGIGINSETANIGFVAYNNVIQFRPPNAANTSLSDWEAFVQAEYAKGTPLTFIYKMSESASECITTELTASEVRTVLGQNNFWSEAGPVTIDYWKH